jgi:WXG100 family type VII secretion target
MKVKADHREMVALAGRLRKHGGDIQTILDGLDSKVSTLSGEWVGDASSAYQTAHKAWTQVMGKMKATLDALADVTEQVQQGYAAFESDVSKQLS